MTDAALDPGEFAVVRTDTRIVASREGMRVKVVPAGEGEEALPVGGMSAFHRNIRNSQGAAKRWLVVELKGVRLYVDAEDGRFFLSDRDIYSW